MDIWQEREKSIGMKHTEESRQSMSKSKKGIKLSEEHRKSISEAVKKKAEESPNYNRSGNNLKQPIEYDSLIEAANMTGSKSNCIQMCCVGKYKHSNGFIWKYK